MNLTNLLTTIDGKKTYGLAIIGMITVALNHFGWWPSNIIPLTLDPSNWLNDEWLCLLAITGKSALTKVGK